MHREGSHGHKNPLHLTVLNIHSTPAACFQGHYTGYLDVMTAKAKFLNISESCDIFPYPLEVCTSSAS